ncbi:MAG TPA: SDR family oxidoreductase [Acidimicrobiia bacterium]|jgi:NAD(P)-dependent dehydrogenase (short-subunit alcohol dehydrogenase family)|nr:SDR family oxidoreductase [Acidimicrobiia bacterium]HEV3450707.1 SDR family oxidoreductase [Acidimicrobiia bacterium]
MSRVLITGCSTGFGRAAAVELTKRGHEVVATARRPETLDDLDVASRLALDVDDPTSVRAAVDAAGPVDALVNNAGFGVAGPVETVSLDAARRCMETNLFGAARMIQAVLPGLRARGGGTIVNVSSAAGRVGAPLDGFYSATKWALEGLSESLHFEVSHFGIRVRIVEPGAFETAFDGNAVRGGIEGTPYEELDRQWEAARPALIGDGPPPTAELVASVIADAIESTAPRLRWLVGPDAELAIGAKDSMPFEDFESSMRNLLGVTW